MPKLETTGARKLRAFLDRMPDAAAREQFAKRCGTSYGFLKQVANGFKPAGESLAISIDRETAGEVACEDMRRDVAHLFAYLRGTAKRSKVARAAR